MTVSSRFTDFQLADPQSRPSYRRKLLLVIGVLLAALGLGAAGIAIMRTVSPPAASAPTSEPLRTEAPSATAAVGRQTSIVARGELAETLTLTGRVAGPEEASLSFGTFGRVETVGVKPGDSVAEGQTLAEGDVRDVQQELAAARGRLDLSATRLEQAQQQGERRAVDEDYRRTAGLAEAERAYTRALSELERVRTGAPAADRRSAELAVSTAQAALQRAQEGLQRVLAGASEAELRRARQELTAAELDLRRAQAEVDYLQAGGARDAIHAAERSLAQAQNGFDRAEADLNRLIGGPDSLTRAAAEREVQRAEVALRSAEASRSDDNRNGSRRARDEAVVNAQLTLQTARERLAALYAPPPAVDVRIAQRAVDMARSTLEEARLRLEATHRTDPLAAEESNLTLQKAQDTLAAAQSHYEQLVAGPSPDQLRPAQEAVDSARASLEAANGRLAEINSRPTTQETNDALDRVAATEQALARARTEAEQPGDDTAAYDQLVLQRSAEQDRSIVEQLEAEIAAARVVAPFDGVIASVQVKPGDPYEAGHPVLTISRPGDPVVRANLSEQEAGQVSVGQQAEVRVGDEDLALQAEVESIVESEGGFRVASLLVSWPAVPPAIGTIADVGIITQQKQDVLLVPERAVRTAGSRRYVEVLEGEARRAVDVKTGIAGGGMVEIVSGLRPGQVVLVAR
jgi:HlyD family secretion protein